MRYSSNHRSKYNALHSQAKASEKSKVDKQAKARYNATQQVPKGKAKRSSK